MAKKYHYLKYQGSSDGWVVDNKVPLKYSYFGQL